MAKDRAPSFQWYPDDFENDPAVVAMGLMACGAFTHLLNVAWNMTEPGVLEANDRLLARWAKATPGEWRRIRPEVERAFDTESRPGFWVQKRMVSERAQQVERYERAANGARMTNAQRHAQRTHSDTHSGR